MFECEAKRKISKKGNEYICLEITFPNGYKKTVFLDDAEKYIAEMFL